MFGEELGWAVEKEIMGGTVNACWHLREDFGRARYINQMVIESHSGSFHLIGKCITSFFRLNANFLLMIEKEAAEAFLASLGTPVLLDLNSQTNTVEVGALGYRGRINGEMKVPPLRKPGEVEGPGVGIKGVYFLSCIGGDRFLWPGGPLRDLSEIMPVP